MTHDTRLESAVPLTAATRFPFDCVAATGARISGAAVVLLREDKVTKTDKPYASFTLGNALGRATLPVWSEGLDAVRDIATGSPVLLTCLRGTSKDGAGEWVLQSMRALPLEHPVAHEAQPACPVSLAELSARTKSSLALMSDDARALFHIVMRTRMAWADGTLSTVGELFRVAPAAVGYHHACHRGLWWHTLQVVEAATSVGMQYRHTDAPSLDLDAILLGAWCHDVGKLHEISRAGAYSIAPRGRIMTHMGWGIAMVTEAIARAQHAEGADVWMPTSRQRELIEHTLHIIASHHGRLEWGALLEPCSREAQIVSAADNVSAKVQPISDAIPRDGAVGDGWLTYKAGWRAATSFVSPTVDRFDAHSNAEATDRPHSNLLDAQWSEVRDARTLTSRADESNRATRGDVASRQSRPADDDATDRGPA